MREEQKKFCKMKTRTTVCHTADEVDWIDFSV